MKNATEMLNDLLQEELDLKFNTTEPWNDFSFRIEECRIKFWELINKCKEDGLKIAALGASTKGNVTLQTWGVTLMILKLLVMLIPIKMDHLHPELGFLLKMKIV
jgi:NDP-4-keto-2,6-dideoxyhexose 3-C-methyltransferase